MVYCSAGIEGDREALCRSASRRPSVPPPNKRSQFNRHPDPSGYARAQDGVHHRNTGKSHPQSLEGQPRIGKGSGTTGHNSCGHFGIDRRERFQVPVPVGNLIRLASEAESRNVSIL